MRAVGHDTHEDPSRQGIIEVLPLLDLRLGELFRDEGKTHAARQENRQRADEPNQWQSDHLTFVPGSTSSKIVTRPADFFVAGCEDHALRFDPHELRRLQIRDDDDRLPIKRFRFIFLADARHDLPLLGAEVNLEFDQFFRFRHALGGQHRRRLELNLRELVDGDLRRRGWSTGGCSCRGRRGWSAGEVAEGLVSVIGRVRVVSLTGLTPCGLLIRCEGREKVPFRIRGAWQQRHPYSNLLASG